jgi:hypothetical protein
VLAIQVRVVEQVTLEEKLYRLKHRLFAPLLHTRIPSRSRDPISRFSDADDYTMIICFYVSDLLDTS